LIQEEAEERSQCEGEEADHRGELAERIPTRRELSFSQPYGGCGWGNGKRRGAGVPVFPFVVAVWPLGVFSTFLFQSDTVENK